MNFLLSFVLQPCISHPLVIIMLLFDDKKIKMARKPGKKQKENLVGCTGEVKDEKDI